MGKHRKWDDPTPRSSEKCLEAAKEAAAKVFSRLIAEGKIDPSKEPAEDQPIIITEKKTSDIPLPTTTTTASSDGQTYSCDVEINDITYACRNLLTKSVTQDDILKVSGAKVATRGRFMTTEEKTVATGEKPLYLSVQGHTQYSVDVAVQRILAIIQSMCQIPPSCLTISSGTTNMRTLMTTAFLGLGATPTLAFVQDKLFVGLEHAPHNFDVKPKILGPNGSYLQHIQSETGAKVMLKGKGSGFMEPTSGREAFEPMFIYLQHANHLGLQHAKQLAQNLLETVRKEYANFQQALALAPPSINPGTASMLAGLQQSAAFPPNSQTWNASIRTGYNSGFQYPCRMPGSTPFGAYQPPIGGPMVDNNGSGMFGFHAASNFPMFGVPAMMPPLPPPPPPATVVTTTQISSVSALNSYYEHYHSAGLVQPADSHGLPPSIEPALEVKTARVRKRRFQEKLEEEKDDEDDKDEENGTSEFKDDMSKSRSPAPVLSDKKDNDDFKVPSSLNPTKDVDGFVMPPPLAALKRKRPVSDVPPSKDHSPPLKVSNKLDGLPGALKSVAACYGSESEEDDDDSN